MLIPELLNILINNMIKSEHFDPLKWALTDKAKDALDMMIISLKIDPDLALFMLEQKWPEKDIYLIVPDKIFKKILE